MVETENGKVDEVAKSKRLVAEDRVRREQECMQEVEAVLRRFNCKCEFRQIYVNGQPVQAQLAFVCQD